MNRCLLALLLTSSVLLGQQNLTEIPPQDPAIEQASFKIYQLDNNAVSTAYILADKSFVRAITMDDVIYEKIASANRAVAIVNRIRWQLGSIEQTYEQYQGDEISEHFKTDELVKEIKNISQYESTIGSSVLNPAMEMLKDLLSTKW